MDFFHEVLFCSVVGGFHFFQLAGLQRVGFLKAGNLFFEGGDLTWFSLVALMLELTGDVFDSTLASRMSLNFSKRLLFSSLNRLKRLSLPSLMRVRISGFFGLLEAATWSNFKTCWATDGEDRDLLFW